MKETIKLCDPSHPEWKAFAQFLTVVAQEVDGSRNLHGSTVVMQNMEVMEPLKLPHALTSRLGATLTPNSVEVQYFASRQLLLLMAAVG